MKIIIRTLFFSFSFIFSLTPVTFSQINIVDYEITVDTLSLEYEYICENDTQELVPATLHVNFIYPTSTVNPDLTVYLQSFFIANCFGDDYIIYHPDDVLNYFTEDFESAVIEMENMFMEDFGDERGSDFCNNNRMESIIENSILFNTGNILTYIVNNYQYTGGAHGMTYNTAYVIDLEKMEALSYDDLFIPGSETALSSLLKQKLILDKKAKNEKGLKEIGYYPEAIIPNNNFIVNDKGITFIFGQYEIGPYVLGITEITLPYKEIKKYLLKNSAILTLIP